MAMGIIWEVYLRATQKKGKNEPQKEEEIGKEIEISFQRERDCPEKDQGQKGKEKEKRVIGLLKLVERLEKTDHDLLQDNQWILHEGKEINLFLFGEGLDRLGSLLPGRRLHRD